jgi:hypothetical protein
MPVILATQETEIRRSTVQDQSGTRGLGFEHVIKALAHKGGVRIGKTPKKLASIVALNAEKLKQIP